MAMVNFCRDELTQEEVDELTADGATLALQLD